MKNIKILITFIAFYLFHNHNTLVASEFDLSSGNGLSQEDYFEKVLLIRDPLVVDNPLRTGLNPIKKITQTDDGGIMIITKFPHGRETGDSVVMDGVRGLFVPGFANCNFLAEKINFELWNRPISAQIHVKVKENIFNKWGKIIFFRFGQVFILLVLYLSERIFF